MKASLRLKRRMAFFLVFFFPLFLGLFQFYCLWDADFLGSPTYEAPDLLSQPSLPVGSGKFIVFAAYQDVTSILRSSFFEQSFPISFQISSFDPTSVILRC